MARRFRRSFRGRRRSQWRNQAWGYTPIGEINGEPGLFSCAVEQPPGTQAFWPVLTNQMFAPAAGEAPFKQERVLCLRTLGEIELFYSYAISSEAKITSQVRWALALLDEEAVSDVTYLFPSLFLPDFAQTERVLLTGIAQPVAGVAEVLSETTTFWRNRAWIKFDQGLKTKVETGSTIWLVTEVANCAQASPGAAQLSPWLLGYTRALWRD